MMRVRSLARWMVPSLFAAAAASTGIHVAGSVGHALTQGSMRAWLVVLYGILRMSVACAFALFSHQTRIAVPEAVFKESARRLMADLLKKLDTMKPIDAGALIRAAALKYQVPATLVKSIVAAESNFHCDAVSPRGAIGLMQLMPETALQFGADPTIPEQNIDAGTSYLHFLMHK